MHLLAHSQPTAGPQRKWPNAASWTLRRDGGEERERDMSSTACHVVRPSVPAVTVSRRLVSRSDGFGQMSCSCSERQVGACA